MIGIDANINRIQILALAGNEFILKKNVDVTMFIFCKENLLVSKTTKNFWS